MRRGSICWFDPAPTVGREQQKLRPWLAVGPADVAKAGLVVLCPITTSFAVLDNPSLAPWCVRFSATDVVGPSIEDGVILVHHVRAMSVARIAASAWTRTRLSADILALVATAMYDLGVR